MTLKELRQQVEACGDNRHALRAFLKISEELHREAHYGSVERPWRPMLENWLFAEEKYFEKVTGLTIRPDRLEFDRPPLGNSDYKFVRVPRQILF